MQRSSDLGKRIRMTPKSNKWLLFMLFSPVIVLTFLAFFTSNSAFGQESEEFVIRRVEIWKLFYRLMVAAFVVGAAVQGTIIYVCWRFRESHKKNVRREHIAGAE